MRMYMNKCINVNKKIKLYVYDYCSNVFLSSAYDEINIYNMLKVKILFLLNTSVKQGNISPTKLENGVFSLLVT